MRNALLLLLVLALPGFGTVTWATTEIPALPPAPSEETPIFPKDLIKPGMVGTTYTVLAGNEIVPVHTVILGIEHGALGPGLDMIIAKLDDPKTILTEAVHGMSGSPLYIDGKLVGALSHRIATFEKDGHCGYTPIEDMLKVKDIMDAHLITPSVPLSPNLPQDLHFADTTGGGPMVPLSSPLMVSGVSSDLCERLFKRLHPDRQDWMVVPGGGQAGVTSSVASQVESAAAKPDDGEIKAGSPLAVVFMSGPISMAGTGTCTWRQGNKILAFGHPMSELGTCQYPIAEANIISTIPSYEHPFKMSNTGAIVGTLEQDRATAISGLLGVVPPMASYQVNLSHDGQADPTLAGNFVTDPDELPDMTGAAILSGLEESLQNGHKTSVRVSGQLLLKNHQPIKISGFYSGEGEDPLLNMTFRSLDPVLAVLKRKDEVVTPISLTLNMDRFENLANWTIDSVQTDATTYAPGSTVNLAVRLKADYGDYQTRNISLTLPECIKGQKAVIRLSGGNELDNQTLPDQVNDARSIDQVIRLYNHRRQTDHLYAQVITESSGLLVKGASMPDLPASVQEVMQQAPTTDQSAPLKEDVLLETNTEVPGQVEGTKEVTVQVGTPE